jgi:hypothetical protein
MRTIRSVVLSMEVSWSRRSKRGTSTLNKAHAAQAKGARNHFFGQDRKVLSRFSCFKNSSPG